jgi:hypothetical protein
MIPATLGCEATAGFAAVYAIAGWVDPHVTPHYYQVAQRPELGGAGRRAASWMLRAGVIYALLGWAAEMSAVTHVLVRTWPMAAALLGYAAALFVACFALLMIVWGAFKMNSEYTAVSPEFLVGVAMIGFEVFAIFPRAHSLWSWLPGLG